MSRTRRVERRKHLILLLIALALALGILLIQAETASAHFSMVPDGNIDTEMVTQADEGAGQPIVTTERLLLLGMLGLVVLTWFYLRWRPTPRVDRDHDQDQPSEHQ